jgi:hypothetical protein
VGRDDFALRHHFDTEADGATHVATLLGWVCLV